MTSPEDSPPNEAKEPLVFKKVPSRSSSFIQNILYEDSCTGVTVIDLFVALKSIKENIEYLSLSNEKMSNHVNYLNGETETVWKEFVELLERMRMFLDRMNADVAALNLQNLEERMTSLRGSRTHDQQPENKETGKLENKIKGACAKCGKDLNEIQANNNKKLVCLGCLMSAFKKKFLNQLSISPEAFLGSFLASVLYWQKGKERDATTKSSFSTLGERTSDGSLNIRESTVQMICDICEILNVTTITEREEPLSIQPIACSSNSKNAEDTDDELGWSSSVSNPSKQKFTPVERKSKMGESSKERSESRNELTSEGDSEFEEALTCQLNHYDRITKPSVTCMGDLSKAVSGKKSASTITPSHNIASSWVGKLSDVIKSKIKEIKSKRPNKTNVKVFDEPFEKSETALKNHPGMLQFSITASTSAGVFDVTVVQYKKQNNLAKSLGNCKKNSQPILGFESSRDFNPSPLNKDFKDKWSDDSLTISDSESMETCSNFDDDDMGEFLEIYVENKDKLEKQDKMTIQMSNGKLNGISRKMELKTPKPYFLQFQRTYPVYCAQEFVKKTKKTQQNEPMDGENVSNDGNEEEIFSLKSSERREKQIVIPGSSSDLVIYIQVEIEDDVGSNSNSLVFDFEKNSLGTQTKETPSNSSEKSIRLDETEQKGESLFNVWRTSDPNQNMEEDMERITFEQPLVVIDKLEEEEQQQKKQQQQKRQRVKKKSKENAKKSLSKVYQGRARKIQDSSLDEAKILENASVLIMKEIKQSAPIWYFQVEKNWKLEMKKLIKRSEVPREVLESISSTAGELEKALRLIREIENDIVDAQIDDAISILPRLEIELRKHLHTKIKSLEQKETKSGVSSDNYFSTLDFGEQREDSLSGDSDESSECRFNNLLKLLSNLEDAVKAGENSSNKIELSHYDSSKIYELLHALTDSIRELEEDPNVTSLSQTLDIASRLDTAIREYDSIVKKQPAEYLIPQERSRKRRKPRWNAPDEASVTQHLKNVRKKVFEMVETEAVGMEERIEKDFDRVDRLETENDEAMMFLEALLQKTQKRMSEFESLKTQFKDLFSSLNTMYENFQKVVMQEIQERMESENTENEPEQLSAETSEPNLERIRNRITKKLSKRSTETSENKNSEQTSERNSVLEKTSGRSTSKNTSESYLESIRKRMFESSTKIQYRTPERSVDLSRESIKSKPLERNSETSEKQSFVSVSTTVSGKEKILARTSSKVSENTERSLERIPEKTSDPISKRNLEKSIEKISEKSLERKRRSSEKTFAVIPEITSNTIQERKSSEKNLATHEKTLKKVSDKSLNRTLNESSDRHLNKITESVPSESLSGKISEKSADKTTKRTEKSSERTLKRDLEVSSQKVSEKSLGRTSGKSSVKVSEKSLEKTSEKVSKSNSGRSTETNLNGVIEKVSEKVSKSNSGRSTEKSLNGVIEKVSEKVSKSNSGRSTEKSLNGVIEKVSEKAPSECVTTEIKEVAEKSSNDTQNETTKSQNEESPSVTPPEPFTPPESQESLEQIVSSFINAIDYLKSKSTENKIESNTKTDVSSSSHEKGPGLTSAIKEFKVIGQNSLYLSWTEPEGPLESSIIGYEIHVDGKLNQKVRNPQRVQAVLYSVDLSKKIEVQLYAIVDKNDKVLLASMDLNG